MNFISTEREKEIFNPHVICKYFIQSRIILFIDFYLLIFPINKTKKWILSLILISKLHRTLKIRKFLLFLKFYKKIFKNSLYNFFPILKSKCNFCEKVNNWIKKKKKNNSKMFKFWKKCYNNLKEIKINKTKTVSKIILFNNSIKKVFFSFKSNLILIHLEIETL